MICLAFALEKQSLPLAFLFLEKVDDGSMGFTPAVQISYLKKKEQEEMLEAMDFAQCTPSLSQAIRIKKLSAEGKLTIETMEDILNVRRSMYIVCVCLEQK